MLMSLLVVISDSEIQMVLLFGSFNMEGASNEKLVDRAVLAC